MFSRLNNTLLLCRKCFKPINGAKYRTFIMRVLNVAEKNDAAKNIAALLSRGGSRMREGLSKYNKIYEFEYNIFGQNCKMVMTSVSGHLLGYEFTAAFRGWSSCNPGSLFEAPVIKQCPKDFENIKKTLERETRTCNKLIIWTDCDREGENIGFEIIEVCQLVKPNIDVYRAKFSEITRQSVERAVQNLQQPNKNISDAVNVRQELDLRIGAAFTRFQTLHLKRVFPTALAENLISYGSCQFPTLGFVVERFKSIAEFIPEPFWKIKVTHTKDELTVEFSWKRVKLFQQLACQVLFDTCNDSPTARVDRVQSKPKSKWRPKPLDTVELEKLASRKLHINAKETMRVAEKLYTQGYISYPRTETNIFPKEMDLTSLVRNQTTDPNWGAFANKVLEDGPNPFQGNKSDQAHPPIHPTKYASQLTGNEHKVYDFIVRHFLACLSKHAEGLETCVDVDIAGEKFVAKGLMIIARNYLDVYPFDKWNAKEIHIYQEGDEFLPQLDMVEGETSAPDLLTEADLIALMEKHGIGTDATHADHIETIKARLYVGLKDNTYFVPRTLGMGLVEGYDSMGFEMSKPNLRAELEADLKRICDGVKQPREVLAHQVQKYKEVFDSAQSQVTRLDAAIQTYLHVEPQRDAVVETPAAFQKVMKCPRCGLDMILRTRKSGSGQYVACVGYPGCKEAVWLPAMVHAVTVTPDTCPTCGPSAQLLELKFERGSCYLPSPYTGCIGGCDSTLLDVLNIGRHTTTAQPQENRPALSQSASSSRVHTAAPRQAVEGTSSAAPPRPVSRREADNIDGVQCLCGRPSVRLTVKKQGPNMGRQFFKCDTQLNVRGCDFFKWADDDSTTSTQQRHLAGGANPGEQPNCYCSVESKRLVVAKDGPNKGRVFYCCSKPMNTPERCQFFQWADEVANSTQRPNQVEGTYRRPLVQNNAQPRKRKCGLCGQEGHNRKNCPQK